MTTTLNEQNKIIKNCKLCPRLSRYLKTIVPKKEFKKDDYANHPVPGFGNAAATLMIVGLAPGAHGANRTGRPFTGDKAGLLIYEGLYTTGLSNKNTSTHSSDGLELKCYITNAVKCAPPANKPNAQEFNTCIAYLKTELEIIKPRVILAVGGDAFKSVMKVLGQKGEKKHKFKHSGVYKINREKPVTVVASYHTSAYNQNTGRIDLKKFTSALKKATSL